MARFLFCEVRTKTRLFDLVVRELIGDGHEVSWLVQNHLFTPENYTRLHQIPYPAKKDLKEYSGLDLNDVRESDRMLLYFDKDSSHYSYYQEHIEKIIASDKPEFVIGELGNFHTHMACLICKKQGIPYYDIEGSRYPPGRFSFHLFDRYDPIKISNNDNTDVGSFLEDVVGNAVKPEYMKKNKQNRFLFGVKKIRYRIELFAEYLKGERYCTVSPFVFLSRKKQLSENWKKLSPLLKSFSSLSKKKNILLYPMQMQPEFNLDVWGAEYRDQPKLINRLSQSLPNDWHLVVKLNPKFREDVSASLVKCVASCSNVTFLETNTTMDEVERKVGCVVSVTGTVVLERLFKKLPVLSLGDTFLSRNGFVSRLDWNNLSEQLLCLSDITFNNIEPSGLLSELLCRSTPGRISEPHLRPEALDHENIAKIKKGFDKMLRLHA